jgi:hypothetical protein
VGLLLLVAPYSFVAYIGNAFAYSDWYGLTRYADLAKTAQHRAWVFLGVFVASTLLAFEFLFSVLTLPNVELSNPLKWFARALVSVSIVIFSFALYCSMILVYTRYWKI